jgi:hypothetical protein
MANGLDVLFIAVPSLLELQMYANQHFATDARHNVASRLKTADGQMVISAPFPK